MSALFKQSVFDPARARETARRLREGESAAPLFRSEVTPPPVGGKVVVITNIGAANA